MKTELRLAQHSLTPGHTMVELWYGGKLIGAVYGADGPGVRVVSKYKAVMAKEATWPPVTTVYLDPKTEVPRTC
jgi:hypothetical protein